MVERVKRWEIRVENHPPPRRRRGNARVVPIASALSEYVDLIGNILKVRHDLHQNRHEERFCGRVNIARSHVDSDSEMVVGIHCLYGLPVRGVPKLLGHDALCKRPIVVAVVLAQLGFSQD